MAGKRDFFILKIRRELKEQGQPGLMYCICSFLQTFFSIHYSNKCILRCTMEKFYFRFDVCRFDI